MKVAARPTAKNVEQARVAYGQFLDGMAEAVRAWSTVPSAVMTSGFKVVQERAIQFAKENAEAGFALASELAKAKDYPPEFRTVQPRRSGQVRPTP